MINRPYIVQLSNKTEVKIDSEELDRVVDGISTSSPIRLKQGIVNPSFIIAIVPDVERWRERIGTIVGAHGSDEYNAEYQRRTANGCTPLKDLFEDRLPIQSPSKLLR